MDIDSYTSPEAETLLRAAAERPQRIATDRGARATELAVAAIVLLGAVLLAVFGHAHRHLSLATLGLTVFAFAVAAQVKFPVGAGWARPTQLAFVPMLFLLPLPLVPLVVVASLLIAMAPRFLASGLSRARLPTLVGDAAYAFGPVAVLLVAGDGVFSWDHWPVFAAAFAAQIALDLTAFVLRPWFAAGLRQVVLFREQFAWVYATDLCLACLGLLIAASAVQRPGLVLLALPLIALLGLFARERSERIENTLALSTAYRGTALLLGDVIEDDDEYTGIHSRAVVDLAVAVSERLGLDATQRRNVEFGALLHDVGKIRVPKEIIHKAGKLDDREWAIMREHTIYGEQMLAQVGGTLSSVGKVVRHSHERFDGTGYPDGLAGEQIPIEARIVCACDAFNAMTTHRPYRRAMSLPEAIEEMQRCSGTHFDPRVVYALLATVAERPALRDTARHADVIASRPAAATDGGPAHDREQNVPAGSSTHRAVAPDQLVGRAVVL